MDSSIDETRMGKYLKNRRRLAPPYNSSHSRLESVSTSLQPREGCIENSGRVYHDDDAFESVHARNKFYRYPSSHASAPNIHTSYRNKAKDSRDSSFSHQRHEKSNKRVSERLPESVDGNVGSSLVDELLHDRQKANAALQDLYSFTEGSQWDRSDQWLSPGSEVRLWHGAVVDKEMLTGLKLTRNGLRGQLPPSIGQLSMLRSLDLSFNRYLEGTLPEEIGRLRNLKILNLCGCNFDGLLPESIVQLVKLRELRLSGNRFYGTIPKTLSSLVNLRELLLNSNDFSGKIPTFFSQLINLKVLDLSDNRFSGEIPDQLGALLSLKILRLDGNRLVSSSMPTAESGVELQMWQHRRITAYAVQLQQKLRHAQHDKDEEIIKLSIALEQCSRRSEQMEAHISQIQQKINILEGNDMKEHLNNDKIILQEQRSASIRERTPRQMSIVNDYNSDADESEGKNASIAEEKKNYQSKAHREVGLTSIDLSSKQETVLEGSKGKQHQFGVSSIHRLKSAFDGLCRTENPTAKDSENEDSRPRSGSLVTFTSAFPKLVPRGASSDAESIVFVRRRKALFKRKKGVVSRVSRGSGRNEINLNVINPTLEKTIIPKSSPGNISTTNGQNEQIPCVRDIAVIKNFLKQGDAPDVEHVLLDIAPKPFNLRRFRAWSSSNLMDENLDFYFDVEALKFLPTMEVAFEVRHIIDMYVRPGAEMEINLSSNMRSETILKVNSLLRNLSVCLMNICPTPSVISVRASVYSPSMLSILKGGGLDIDEVLADDLFQSACKELRSVFTDAKSQVFDLLKLDVYPRFVAAVHTELSSLVSGRSLSPRELHFVHTMAVYCSNPPKNPSVREREKARFTVLSKRQKYKHRITQQQQTPLKNEHIFDSTFISHGRPGSEFLVQQPLC